jgi:glucuronokinase
MMSITSQAYARIGLLGNPSDGYFGKTIACTIRNFSASVNLSESPRIAVERHPELDPGEYVSLDALYEHVVKDGYYGGQRLILASCKKFAEYCHSHNVPLARKNFTLRYDTDIPRQVGLAGSSAIITATIKALREYYDVTDEFLPKVFQPTLVLSVEEEELDIRAGLQDRVAQTYGGVTYMDFNKELVEKHGYGEYESLDVALLPSLFLAYIGKPEDSGKAHNDVRERWKNGDREVIDAMKGFAAITDAGRLALLERDHVKLATLMNQNFDLRRNIFGDTVIGAENLDMVRIARENGAPAKFSGSGGAIVGMIHDDAHEKSLHDAYTRAGYSFVRVEPDTPDSLDAV